VHGAVYNIKTGECSARPPARVASYAVRVQGSDVESRYRSQRTGWTRREVAAGALRAQLLGKSGLWRTWGLACLDQATPPRPAATWPLPRRLPRASRA